MVNLEPHGETNKEENGDNSQSRILQTPDDRNRNLKSSTMENGHHKTELNMQPPEARSQDEDSKEIFTSKLCISMCAADDINETDQDCVDYENAKNSTPTSLSQSNLNAFKEKKSLSRTTTQSRSNDSNSDQIGVDYEDSVSGRCSSDDEHSDIDLSSDYGMEKNSPSPSSLSETLELRERKSQFPTPTQPEPTQKSDSSLLKRYDSHPSSGAGHDNLGYIAEESEPEDGKPSTTRNSFLISENGQHQGHDEQRSSSVLSAQSTSASFSYAGWDEAFSLDNLKRVILRDVRKEIDRTSDRLNLDTFLRLIKQQELLQKLFDLFDRKQQKQLNQHEWIEFLKFSLNATGPNREERRVDFVELVESVTYAVCGDDNVDFEKFRTIFGDKNVLTKFFRLIDRDGDGVVTAEQIMEFISQLSSTRSNSRLTKENIAYLKDLFLENVGEGSEIRKEDFKRIIQTKNEFFLDRVFDIFDEDGSGSISLHEFLDAMHKFAGQDADDKIRFLFKVYDVDGDGVIRCEELGKVIRACLAENGMRFSDTQVDELTRALFEDADVEGKGALSFDALKGQLKKHPGLLENMSIMLDQWLVPPKKEDQRTSIKNWIANMKPHSMSMRYIKNNYVFLIWRFIYFFVNIALFTSRCVTFHQKNPNATVYLKLARGAGQCLNFNCAFVVVLMLRKCLTFLRARGFSAFIPIDQHIKFHKMTGKIIFFFGILHTVMHLVNISEGLMPVREVNIGNWSYMEFLFDPAASGSLGLIPGYAFNSGVVIILILLIMVIGSMPFVRRGGCFEVFYWTHLLYYVFWALLIIHAPNFWKWFLGPGILFLVEQAYRYYNWRVGRGLTCVSSGILLPSKVTHLVIRRPPNFDFHPGDYVYVRIPKIAKAEWHPFTISSAPEQDDAIWLHIRACGEWTSRLHEYFEKEQEKLKYYNDSAVSRRKCSVQSPPQIITNNERQVRNVEHPKSDKPEYRNRLPTVGVNDSQETVDPTSSNSTVQEENNEVTSSVETVNECDVMIRTKNVPIKGRKKPKLVSTNSLPNVHDRTRKVKMQVRTSAPQFQRSMSVNEMENQEAETVPSMQTTSVSNVRARRTTAASFKYMRNKPTVISLKTPSYEENYANNHNGDASVATSAVVGIVGCEQQLAEEGGIGGGAGISAGGNTQGDLDFQQVDREGSELHPILGTTNMKHGTVAVGRPLEIYLDGPYGAPSSHIFRAEHAVLIATGIGVTPFASILQSIMHRYWASRICCPNCDFTWCGDLPQSVLNLKKVDFFWINRDQRSFEWFVHLLSQLEIEQAESGAMERFLDMHMYITSALQRTDMKAVGLQLALDLLHEKEKRDLITGLKTRTNAGRPNWNKVFQQIAEQRKGKVTVYYCGPPALARTLKFKCDEFGFTFRKEIF